MLFKVIFALIANANALPSAAMRSCIDNVLLSRNHSEISLNAKRVAQGEGSLSKEFRQAMANSKPAKYDKHILAKSEGEAIALSLGGRAQYMPYINRVTIEKHALTNMKGIYKTHSNTVYKYVEFVDDVGFADGKKTKWLRIEWSSGSYHGHPIDLKRVMEQCKECI